jgi:hypothetical protein
MNDDEARARARAKGGKLPPGVYWRHQTLWISYYITGADGRRTKHREPTKATSPARRRSSARKPWRRTHGASVRSSRAR